MDVKDFMRDLGAAIGARRRAMKLTQEELAERLDTSPEWVSQVERGVGKPSLETLLGFAAVLQVPLGELVVESGAVGARRADAQELIARVRDLDDRAVRVLVETARALDREYAGKPKRRKA